jgi:pyruvate/2-oxoglutarate dehydrogenase complex dihydrolipoamide dehydrogenase (E3) component
MGTKAVIIILRVSHFIKRFEAKRLKVEYRLVALPMATVLRTRTVFEHRGFLKMLIGAQSYLILGFTAFGVDASESPATVQSAMPGRLSCAVVRDGIFTHSTVAEGLPSLLTNVPAAAQQL